MEEEKKPVVKIRYLPSKTGMRKVDQDVVLRAILESEDGDKSDIAERMSISRTSLCKYIAESPVLAEAYAEVVGKLGDRVESELVKKIKNGDSNTIIFYCKTKLKDRGYVEKQQIEHDGAFGVYGGIINHRIIEFRGLEPLLQARTAITALNAHLALKP